MAVSDADVVARLRLNTRDFNEDLRKAVQDAAQRLGGLNQGLRGVEGAARRARTANAQLGQQLQDITIQAQAGTSAFVIFGQQSGQVATALSGFGGVLGRVGGFLAGPWGAAISAAVIGLGVLYNTTFNSKEAQDEHAKAVKTDQEALEDLAKASGLAKRSAEEELAATVAATEAKLRDALATRAQIAAKLELARGFERQSNAPRGDGGNLTGIAGSGMAAAYQGLAATNAEAIRALEDGLKLNKGFFQAAQAAAAATDATAAATQRFDREVAAAKKTFAESAKTEADRLVLTNALIAAENRKAAAVKASAEATRAGRRGERAEERLEDRYAKELRALEGKREQIGLIATEEDLEAQIAREILSLRERLIGLDPVRLANLEAETRELLTQRAIFEAARKGDRVVDDLANGDIVQRAGAAATEKGLDEYVKAADDSRMQAMLDRYREEREQAADLALFYEDLFTAKGSSIWKSFKAQGLTVLSRLASGFTVDGKGGLEAAIKGTGFDTFARLLGGGGKDGGAAEKAGGLAGSLGKFLGPGSPLSGAVGAVSKALPYVGAAIQAFQTIKGLVSMFQAPPKATATVTTGDGAAIAGGAVGSKSLRDAAQKLGNAFADQINRIAESLGADVVDGLTLGSIGKRGKNFVYDPTGQGRTKGAGVVKSKDQSVVELAAFKDAVRDGAIGGTSQTVLNALLGGTSIADAQDDAGKVAQFLRDARRLDDPLGAALEEVEDKFKSLERTLKAAGATTEEMAKFERLRAAEIEKATAEAATALREFRDSLNFGSSSPLALRDQEAAARANFDAQAARIGQAGFDQSKFVDAGRALLDVRRALDGSTEGYFEEFRRVQELTNKAIEGLENVVAINPLEKATADATAATARAADSMDHTLREVLATLRGGLLGGSSSSGGATTVVSSFIGGGNGFTRDARVDFR